MKKLILSGALFAAALLTTTNCQAQSWKDLFKKDNISKVVDVVKEHATPLDLTGTWHFQGSAVDLESDNLLSKAGGEAASKMAEKKLNEQLDKFDIRNGQMSFTFNADSTFTSSVGKKTLQGTYSYNHSTKEMDLKYLKLVDMHAKVKRNPDSIELLFNSDKLLKLIAFIGSKSQNASLRKISSLTDKYNGMKLGFQLVK